MPAAGKNIHGLSTKITIVAELLYYKGTCSSRSIRQLAISAGIEPTTLAKACAQGSLTTAIEEKIAKLADFSTTDVYWHDPTVPDRYRSMASYEYIGKDKAENFRTFLFGKHGMIDAAYRKIFPCTPSHSDENLATFALEGTGQAVRDDEPLLMFFRVVMKPCYYDRLVYGFNKVRLKIRELNDNKYLRDLLSDSQRIDVCNAVLSVRGGRYNPEWFLSVDKGILDGEYYTNDPLCALQGAKIGDEVKAELSVHQYDGSLVWKKTGLELEDSAKEAVLSAMCASELNSNCAFSSGGWLSLGMQTIKVVRGDM